MIKEYLKKIPEVKDYKGGKYFRIENRVYQVIRIKSFEPVNTCYKCAFYKKEIDCNSVDIPLCIRQYYVEVPLYEILFLIDKGVI